MEIEIGTASREEVAPFLRPISVAFGNEPADLEWTERFGSLIEPERMHVARENGAIVGAAGAFTYELTVPGGFVPAAGVTVVGVLPTHRRRGILTNLMRTQLDDVHRRGEPVAYLWATEERIYGRFGYGVASLLLNAEIDVRHVAFRNDAAVPVRARLVDADEAYELIPAIYERVRAETPGMFSRDENWWRRRSLFDAGSRAGGALFRVVVELDDAPEAYALYRLAMNFDAMSATIDVNEAFGISPRAVREIWRYLLAVDLVRTVKAGRLPMDHPLLLAIDRTRALNAELWDGVWLRVVDVERALAARTLRDGEVVLELRDAFCPWNEGRWRVHGGGAERTDAEADLRCDITELGSVYLGAFTWTQLVRAGQVEETRDGAAARADAIFHTDRAPWCPEIF